MWCAVAALLAAGCASTPRDAQRDDAPVERAEAERVEMIGPEPLTLDRADAAAPAAAEPAPQPARRAEPAPAPRAPAESTTPGSWRADGRPTWWLDAPVRDDDGRIELTAEALADDVLNARRAAVDAGRAALARETGDGAGNHRIEALTVRRLSGDRPGGARYVGYVRLSAGTSE